MATDLTSAQTFRLEGFANSKDLDERIKVVQWDPMKLGPVLLWPDGKRRVLSPRGRLLAA